MICTLNIGEHSWTVEMTHKKIDNFFELKVNDWRLFLSKISSFFVSKGNIYLFNSFWSGFTIFMNGLYWFEHVEANLTLFFNSLRSSALFSSCLCFKGMCQAKFDISDLFYLHMLKPNSKTGARVWFAMVHEFKKKGGWLHQF